MYENKTFNNFNVLQFFLFMLRKRNQIQGS